MKPFKANKIIHPPARWIRISKPTHTCTKKCRVFKGPTKEYSCEANGLWIHPIKMKKMAESLRNNPEWENEEIWK